MHKVVYLGCVVPKVIADAIRTKCSYYDIPGDVLQNALISGFDAVSDLHVVTSPNIKGIEGGMLDSFDFSHNGIATDFCVGFRDWPLVRELSVANKFLDTLNRSGHIDIIFIYSIGISQLLAAKRYKKKHPDVKVIEMITDIPMFMREHPSLGYKIAKGIVTKINYGLMKCVDGFALLSMVMSEHIPTRNKPVVQIEGIFDSGCVSLPSVQKGKNILYSGNLGKRYGIIDLLEAFTRTSIDYKLQICGVGDGVDEIKRYAEKDNRIKFLGSLTRKEVLRLQRESSLLINPRHRTDAFTRYSFPSKTMEYMASGTPTLMSELDCLPADYKRHLYFFDDESIEGMARKIEEICSKPQEELDAFGEAASEFILKNKNAAAQVRKMLEALGMPA